MYQNKVPLVRIEDFRRQLQAMIRQEKARIGVAQPGPETPDWEKKNWEQESEFWKQFRLFLPKLSGLLGKPLIRLVYPIRGGFELRIEDYDALVAGHVFPFTSHNAIIDRLPIVGPRRIRVRVAEREPVTYSAGHSDNPRDFPGPRHSLPCRKKFFQLAAMLMVLPHMGILLISAAQLHQLEITGEMLARWRTIDYHEFGF